MFFYKIIFMSYIKHNSFSFISFCHKLLCCKSSLAFFNNRIKTLIALYI